MKSRIMEMRRLLRLNRVRLALYMCSCEKGLFASNSNVTLAQESGVSKEAVRECLATLVELGEITIFDTDDGISFRMIILNDHPEAAYEIEFMREVYCPHGRRARRGRGEG